MKRAYDVSLKEFAINDGVALAKKGTTELGRVNALELLQVLMIFQDISPIQHFEGEPTIVICTKSSARYLVRTDLHKLMLYDTRQMQVPALVLEAASILLEIEDNPGALRNRIKADLTKAAHAIKDEPAPKKVDNTQLKQLLGFVAALILLIIVVVVSYSSDSNKGPQFEVMEEESLPPLLFTLLGNYSSGTGAEDYELAILESRELRLMQVSAKPPRLQKAPYKIGTLEGKTCIVAPGFETIYIENHTLRMGKLLFKKK